MSNLGVAPIRLKRGERVFTVQFHNLDGTIPDRGPKDRIGPIVAEEAHRMGDEASLGFVSRIEDNLERKLGARLDQIEHGTERVIMFGILLVASALLAGAFTALFAVVEGSQEKLRLITFDTLEGALLIGGLFGVCIVLSVSVLTLGIASIVQAFKSPKGRRGT